MPLICIPTLSLKMPEVEFVPTKLLSIAKPDEGLKTLYRRLAITLFSLASMLGFPLEKDQDAGRRISSLSPLYQAVTCVEAHPDISIATIAFTSSLELILIQSGNVIKTRRKWPSGPSNMPSLPNGQILTKGKSCDTSRMAKPIRAGVSIPNKNIKLQNIPSKRSYYLPIFFNPGSVMLCFPRHRSGSTGESRI